jgi:hypothetical protein
MLHTVRSRHFSNALTFRLSILLNVFAGLLLLGVASPLWAQVTTTQSAVAFGPVAVGASTGSTQSLSFTVPSGITLGGISALTLGAANLDFTVVAGGTCASGSTSTTCTVRVQFLPKLVGTRMGAVVLADQSTPPNTLITVPLSGIGSGPQVAFGPGIITTSAGNGTYGYSGDTAAATSAELANPYGVAVDGAGNLYIADNANNRIRKVTPGGTITNVAGTGTAGYNGDNIPATSASLAYPGGVAVDGAGNLYIADYGNNRIRKVTLGGTITTVAGTGTAGYNGDNIAATSAEVSPSGVAVDGAGNLYIADMGNNRIRKVTPGGTITTVAGTGTSGYNGDNIAATSAEVNPYGVAVDGAGNFYIADYGNSRIRKVTPGGIITTVAGTGTPGYSGDNGAATSAELDGPYGVAVDGTGNLYIADVGNNVIRKVTPGGTITSVAGNGTPGYSGDGGSSTSASLYHPYSVAVDGSGNFYIGDWANNVIRKVDLADAPALSFANTFFGGASASQEVTVLNLGNEALTISQISTAPNFTLGGSGTSCSPSGQSLQPAANCVLGIEFNPEVVGSIAGSVVLTDNALNATAATQTITLQGSGIDPLVSFVVAPNPVALGGTTVLTATVSPITATGVVTFTVTSSKGVTTLLAPPVSVSAGVAMLSQVASAANGFSAGANLITASYNTSAQSLSAPLTVTGVAATTTTTVGVSASPVAVGGTVTLTASIGSATAGAITGEVTFTVTSSTGVTTVLAQHVPVSGGQAVSNVTVSAPTFTAGNTITAIYSGNANYEASTGSTTLTVTGVASPTTTTLAASPSSLTLGGTTTLTASVGSTTVGTITGSVTFMVGSTTLGTAPLSSGLAILSNVAVNAAYGFYVGTDTVTAIYSGDASYASSTVLGSTQGSTTLTVTSPPVTTTTLTAAPPSATFGGTTELVASVTSTAAGTIAGTVTFTAGTTTIGTATVSGGWAKLFATVSAANGFSVGTDTVTATYGGSANYAASSGTGTLTVLAATTTTLTAAPVWVTLGGATELVASVTSTTAGSIAGTVTFTVGNTTLGTSTVSGGLATLGNVAVSATNGFSVGTDTITATYNGSASYGTSTVSTTMTVTGSAVTTTTVTAIPAWVTLAGTTELVASVVSTTAGTVAGTVTFSIGSTILGTVPVTSGLATLSNVAVNAANGFLAGTNTITASYSGNSNYAASTCSTSLWVTGSAVTTTMLTAAPPRVAPGGTTALTAVVSSTVPGTLTGTVTFSMGGTTIGTAAVSGGLATLSNVVVNGANGFFAGSDWVTATYGGNVNYASSNGSTTLSVTGPSVTTTTLTAAPASQTLGGTTDLVAAVNSTSSGTISGTVTFSMGGTTLGTAPISGGWAKLHDVSVSVANGFIAGTDTVTASYGGNADYAASSGSATLTVLAVTTTTLTAAPAWVTLGATTELVASLNSTTGGTIAGTVTFSMGSKTLGTATVSGGLATLGNVAVSAASGFVAGTNTITASFGGSAIYAASTGSTSLNVTGSAATTTTLAAAPASVAPGGTTTLTAAVSSTITGTLTGTVTFSMGSTTLGTAPLSGGLATLGNVAVSTANGFVAGTNTITASYGGNANYASSNCSTTLTVAGPAVTTTTLTAAPASLTLGGATELVASVSSTATGTIAGTVTFSMGGATLGTAPVSGGWAKLANVTASATNGFIAGTNTIKASYGGNANYASSTASAALTALATTTTTLTAAPASLTLGSTTELVASVSSTTAGTITGTVTFSLGSTPLGTASVSGGLATISNAAVTAANGFIAGTDTITATYGGGAGFTASTGSMTLTVAPPLATTTKLTAAPASVTLGGTTALTASVGSTTVGAITGTVTFSMGSTILGTAPLSGGLASLSNVAVSAANGFLAGTNTITASYGGGGSFAASTGGTTLKVAAAPAYAMSVSAATTALTAGNDTTVTLNLTSDNYAGTVSFSVVSSAPSVNASAPSVTLTSSGNGSSTLTISATASAAKQVPGLPWKGGGAMMLCAVLLGAPFSLRRKRAIAVLLTALAISLAGLLMACGGGSSARSSTATVGPRTYTVMVTPTGTGTVTNPAPVSITVTIQ